MSNNPWWYPEPFNAEYAQRLREDYPENAHMSDDDLWEYYCDSRKYPVTWDHVGDAYDEYEPLVDAYFSLRAENSDLREALRWAMPKVEQRATYDIPTFDRYAALIAGCECESPSECEGDKLCRKTASKGQSDEK